MEFHAKPPSQNVIGLECSFVLFGKRTVEKLHTRRMEREQDVVHSIENVTQICAALFQNVVIGKDLQLQLKTTEDVQTRLLEMKNNVFVAIS